MFYNEIMKKNVFTEFGKKIILKQFLSFYIPDESKVTPEWNFYKYLVNHEGKILNVYPPRVSVDHAFDEVHKAVKKARRASKQKPKTVKKELHNEL